MNTFETPCCVRGYHIYKDIRTAAVGEILFCVREPTNASDRYAVADSTWWPWCCHRALTKKALENLFAFYDSEPFGSGSPSRGLK